PPHVKFIFCTTDPDKLPITVLSRCQRFDLRRIDADTLTRLYRDIAKKENVTVAEEALALIARAADGSARDGLSLLDQAISLSADGVTAAQVQDMLGLADRARVMDVLEHAIKGKCKEALDIAEELYKSGCDPVVLLQDMLDFTHLLTKLRAVPQTKETHGAIAQDTLSRTAALATKLSMPSLGRAWQILLKGIGEVNTAPNPQAAAEMIIIRLAYAADLPDPGELIKKLKNTNDSAPSLGRASEPQASREEEWTTPTSAALPQNNPPSPAGGGLGRGGEAVAVAAQPHLATVERLETLSDIVALLEQNREMILAGQVFHYAHLVTMKQGAIELRLEPQADPKLAQNLRNALIALTGDQWMISVSGKPGAPTLAEDKAAADAALMAEAKAHPIVAEVLHVFPGASVKVVEG
ncbi:MAG: DNA polymerase III subunit gamma/tau, partial [Alphaproteobacteria bacterium]|nr:DNA polymerase III subunit gamma/tau [Alphaproteobacteria bacterium]